MGAYELLMKAIPALNEERERHEWVRKELLSIPARRKILDAGAGECIYKKYCAHLTYVSQDFCQYNGKGDAKGLHRKNWRQKNIDIISDVESIPVPSRSFDVILCTEVLEHIPHPEKALAEFFRILRPGGLLLLTAPFTSQTHFAPHHYSTGFSKYYYDRILPEHGFQVTQITPSGNYWTVLRTETIKMPSVLRKYSKFPLLWPIILPVCALDVIVLSCCNIMTTRTEEQLCNTHLVKAYKPLSKGKRVLKKHP
jgi:ubiquinone/menaquinone biosynthesis C-methylase UbiE